MNTLKLAGVCFSATLLITGVVGWRAAPGSAQSFDVCLEDDAYKGSALRFNSRTGDYRFCAGGYVSSGRGSVTKMGSVVALQHNAADRRVIGRIDTSAKNGSAMLQSPPGMAKGTVRDSNTSNSSCACR